MENISNRIITLMNNKNMKPADLCKAIDIDKSSMSRLLKGSTSPSSETLYKISNYFEVSMEFLLTGKDRSCTGTTIPYCDQLLIDMFHKLDSKDQSEIIAIMHLKLSLGEEGKKTYAKSSSCNHTEKHIDNGSEIA